ncbi:MAG: hypothetical protein AB9891_06685 [Anaerolineaceae bacterium]
MRFYFSSLISWFIAWLNTWGCPLGYGTRGWGGMDSVWEEEKPKLRFIKYPLCRGIPLARRTLG